jgi:hypothetical protein
MITSISSSGKGIRMNTTCYNLNFELTKLPLGLELPAVAQNMEARNMEARNMEAQNMEARNLTARNMDVTWSVC